MRRSDGRQLARYLFIGWVVGVLTLTGMMHVTHETLHHEDWIVIIGTACIIGGIFWHIYEFWRFEETRHEKNRGVTSR